jgi:hypothetical protein
VPYGLVQHAFEQRVVVDDLLLAVLPLDEVLVHAAVERAGPEERERGDQVLEAARAELGDHLPHAAAFHLEDADGVALGEELVGLGVVERELREVEVCASGRWRGSSTRRRRGTSASSGRGSRT